MTSSDEITSKARHFTHLEGLSAAHLFALATTVLAVTILPIRYLASGAPLLTGSILLGAANGYCILPFLNLWFLLVCINVTYFIASTSWLLYYVYAIGCYPMLLISCLYQFDMAADLARKYLRQVLRMLDFTEDKIAFFDLPALEIDTPDVKGGLMVIRGLTISLSSLTIICHGIEVGIKLSDDMELALVTDEVKISLFRGIRVSDCYGNLKGGLYEMTFGQLAPDTRDADGNHIMFETDTPILQAAGKAVEAERERGSVDYGQGGIGFSRTPTRSTVDLSNGDFTSTPSRTSTMMSDFTPSTPSRSSTLRSVQSNSTAPELPPRSPPPQLTPRASPPQLPPRAPPSLIGDAMGTHPVPMADHLTGGAPPESDTSPEEAMKTIKKLSPDNEGAAKKYREALRNISETSIVNQARTDLETRHSGERYQGSTRIIGDTLDIGDNNALRSATCAWLHDQPSVFHPAQRSIKVTTLQNMSPPHVRRFMHRLPLLLRLLLNPLAYFHPLTIDSITAGASGKWIEQMLQDNVFKNYPDQDSDVRKLWTRVSSWLTDANFVLQLGRIDAQATVPIITSNDLENHLSFDDVMAYRTVSKDAHLKQVVRLGGADARIQVPSFLLPHHEHLIPPFPTKEDERAQQKNVDDAEGRPKTVQAEAELEKIRKDEATGKVAVHVRLPAVFDQELINFIAALVKATKLIEMEKSGPVANGNLDGTVEEKVDTEVHGRLKGLHISGLKRDMKDFTSNMTTKLAGELKHSIKRTTVEAVVNDRWIAKMVGKVARQVEDMVGDVGYSGDLPISLEPYRKLAEPETKILP